MNVALQAGALLLCLNLLAGDIGNLSATTRAWLALFLWSVAWLPTCFRSLRGASPMRGPLALLTVAVALVGLRCGGSNGAFGILLTLLIPIVLRRTLERSDAETQALVLTAAFAALVLLVRETLPWTFVAMDQLAALISKCVALASGSAVDLGPTYSGIGTTALFLLFHLVVCWRSHPRDWALFLKLVSGQVVLLVTYGAVFHRLLGAWALDSAWLVLGVAQLGLFALGLPLVAVHLRRVTLKTTQWQWPGWPALAMVAGCFAFFAGEGHFRQPSAQPSPRVLLYDDRTLDWSVPVYGRYSGISGGMFGSLPTFLRRHHCEAFRGSLTNQSLDRVDVLVIFNLMRKFSAEEKRRIWEFVGKGGGLLAVGDHTGAAQIREPFNDLLTPVEIRFNFDSAMPIRPRWAQGLRWFPHYVTSNLDSESDIQINVGASLSLGASASPLVVGTHGFSDRGNLLNQTNGYLGDMRYTTDERLGDVVLVATARHGQGRVMVFGDTTTFQNAALPRSGDFVMAVVRWLSAGEWRLRRYLSVVFLAVAAVGLWLLGKRSRNAPGLVVSVFIGLYLGQLGSANFLHHRAGGSGADVPAGEALIDCSHLSRCDQDLWQPDGLGGLAQNLMRKAYMPVVTTRFSPELIKQSRLVFLISPAAAFGASESAAWEEFVKAGGQLFVSVGYEEAGGCRKLLDRFGLGLRNLPLGQVGPEANDAKAWFLNAWPVTSRSREAEVVCRQGDYPLIARVRFGKGSVVLIGDSGFLLNRNLEMPKEFNLQNIEFLRKLIPDHE